ncbi:hypothetical protein [Pedobacter sp. D749]|uniref:DUF6922 domain-containing protein n=1 Tax=Pedobacter sp. D749 TaxID=2856523 RepID=UPI001C58EFFF|nr:hypothetical protein [Pedobacter sp. D749]QXU42406.1 hypothetical protein KYH19_02045 [Pedobacter sp. D749]
MEEGTILILQAYYEIQKEKDKLNASDKPNLSILRKILFWDTDFDKINWKSQYKSVIQRVWERGNRDEKNELIRYYGKQKVDEVEKDDNALNRIT